MAQSNPNTQGNTVELQEEAGRICERLVGAYAMMQEALRRNGAAQSPSPTPALFLHTSRKNTSRGWML